MNLEELLRETDALTYVNALKVTLTEVKDELNTIEEMVEYITEASVRIRKLVRKADNQYRLVTKLVNKTPPLASDVTMDTSELEDLMENTNG